MPKVHPNATDVAKAAASSVTATSAVVLTVWKKSLLMNCDGFTVFDAKGNLVFRVDNYVSSNKGEVVLMDASGKSLLTIRRKKLSLADNWLVYDGDTAVNPRYSTRKHMSFLNGKTIAHVNSGSGGRTGSRSSPSNKNAIFEIEGSYSQRCCAMYDGKRRRVAEIKRKEAVGGVALGTDVFRLVVQPEIDSTVAMALVILLDQMFGSHKRFSV